MKGVLSMKTNMQEINEPAFHAYLKKAQSSPNTIRSCLAAYRLYHSLYNDCALSTFLAKILNIFGKIFWENGSLK